MTFLWLCNSLGRNTAVMENEFIVGEVTNPNVLIVVM